MNPIYVHSLKRTIELEKEKDHDKAKKASAAVPPMTPADQQAQQTATPTPAQQITSTSIQTVPAQRPAVEPDSYYQDTIGKAGEALPVKRKTIESTYDKISIRIDEELKKDEINYEKILNEVFKIVALMMRLSVKTDQEYINQMKIEIKAESHKIKATYNTWTGITITVISAGVCIAGAAAGFAQFAPAKYIAADTGTRLAGLSQSVGTAGTGIQSLGTLETNRKEGERQFRQLTLKTAQDKEEDRKNAKHGNKELGKKSLESVKEVDHLLFETFRSVAGG